MIRTIISAALLALATAASAYEKIEFKGLLTNPAMTKPTAVALNGGKVYVTDSKAGAVFVFGLDGKFVKKFEGAMKAPEAASFGGGNLYVADTGNSRVAVFDADGKMLWAFSSPGDAPGQLEEPKGIAFGPDNRLYVSNTGNSRVEVFNADGVYLYGFPVARQDGVTKLNPGKIVLTRSGDILVSDAEKGVVQRYDRAGKLLKEYAKANNGAAADKYGFLYFITSKDGKVREHNEAGEEIATFGTKGKGKSEFKLLRDIAIGDDGVFYLCDEENKKVVMLRVEGNEAAAVLPQAPVLDRFTVKGPVAKFNVKADVFAVTPDGKVVAWLPEAKELALLDGQNKKTLAKEGKLDGQVRSPRGLFVDEKGRIFVADTGNDRVQILNPDGTFDNQFGESGSGEGQFRQPSGVAVSSKGNIYVADTKNKMLKAFSADGMFLYKVGPQVGNVTLQSPVAVRCDEKRNVYVLDSALKKVVMLNEMGKFLALWDDSGKLQDPSSLAYDNKGFFYVLDRQTYNVKIFDDKGAFTASFFAKGRSERELWAPQFLAFAGDKIYVSDFETGRLTAFDISYLPEAPTALAGEATEKTVKLSWEGKTNAWTNGYKLFRGESPADLKEVASLKEKAFEDKDLKPATKYYYAAAGVSASGFQGVMSAPVEVFYKGPEAPAPATASAEASGPRKNAAPLEIIAPKLDYIFSANYKQHSPLSENKKPIGVVTVQNNTDTDFSGVVLSFFSSEIMESESSNEVGDVKAGGKVDVPVYATFSNRVLNITEDTPIQCRMTLSYYKDGEEKKFTMNKPMKVLSRDAIVWDNTARLSNFITIKDTPVEDFRSFAQGEKKNLAGAADNVHEKVVSALMVWEALGDMGISYQPDPAASFASLKSSQSLVLDSVQFPRKTLKLKSGDCDDLTALFASLFESSGLNTALLDYPGHIALMFDTEETDAVAVGFPESAMIKHNGTWWIGVEITMLGKGFYDAVIYEAELFRKAGAEAKVVEMKAAREEFAPVTLPAVEGAIPKSTTLTERAKSASAALAQVRYEHLKSYYGNILTEDPEDIDANIGLGALHGGYKADGEAQGHFDKVLKKEPYNAAALNNLGNLRFNEGKFEEAKEYYFKASKADPMDGNIWLNLARVSSKLGKKGDVEIFAKKAEAIDNSLRGTAAIIK